MNARALRIGCMVWGAALFAADAGAQYVLWPEAKHPGRSAAKGLDSGSWDEVVFLPSLGRAGSAPAGASSASTPIVVVPAYPAAGYGDPYGYVLWWSSGAECLWEREYSAGRTVERYRQDVAELRALVEELRRRIGDSVWTHRLFDDRDEPAYRRDGEAGAGWDYRPGPFRMGRMHERYRQQELAAREELTLLAHSAMLREGLAAFRAGRYAAAARSFLGAAEKNQADAASRLHAAQALMGLGRYSEALRQVRRAFELQPLLAHLPIDLGADYGIKADFAKHLERLRAYCRQHPRDADAHLLLAYEHLFSSTPAEAAEPLRHARKLAPKDPLAAKLWDVAKLFVPADEE